MKVAVGMSGGIDSTFTAYLLQEQGYDVIGITMKVWDKEEENSPEVKAAKVCEDMGIEHYVVDFRGIFQKEVVDYFIQEYEKGRTPNPCVMCNKHIKMEALLNFAQEKGADYLATGHYANVKDGKIYMGEDPKKDQAYFLAQIKKENIKKILFPLGDYKKEDIKKIAKEKNIQIYSSGESQEICFIEDDDYKRFLKEVTKGKVIKKGEIVDENGEKLGSHIGLPFYTIGQRKGLGISSPHPLYVLGFDKEKNQVIVGKNEKLFEKSLQISTVNLLAVDNISELDKLTCQVKTRSRDVLHEAVLNVVDSNNIIINFKDQVRAVTPGQLAVMYDENGLVLGSGFIAERK